MQNDSHDISNKAESQYESTKAQRIFNFVFFVIGYFGILLYVLSFFFQPGKYSGLIDGSYILSGANYSYYHVYFESETTPKWAWKEPENFEYTKVDLELNRWDTEPMQQIKASVYFPSLVCEYENKKASFSRDLLIQLLNVNTESLSDETFLEQVDKLFKHIVSAGDGTLPKPRHHMYHSDELNYSGTFVHFVLGNIYFPPLGILFLGTAIICWVLCRLITINKQPKSAKKAQPLTVIAGLHLVFFFVGLFLNFFGGWTDWLGAVLCGLTAITGIILVPLAVFYAFVAYFHRKQKQLDVLGIALSILFLMILISFLSPPR